MMTPGERAIEESAGEESPRSPLRSSSRSCSGMLAVPSNRPLFAWSATLQQLEDQKNQSDQLGAARRPDHTPRLTLARRQLAAGRALTL
jgi:hypothetical protein